jgi:hypothetical protein
MATVTLFVLKIIEYRRNIYCCGPKSGRHDVAELLLKVGLNTKNLKSCITIELAVLYLDIVGVNYESDAHSNRYSFYTL